MMCLKAMVLLAMLALAMVVLPYASLGQHVSRPDGLTAGGPVCMANLHAGVTCEPMIEQHQAMVMVRGQLLPVQ